MKVVAFIPARSGSKRVPDKNIKELSGHPLLAYTVSVAIDSCVFDKVICATDSAKYAEIASYYGAEVPFLRTKEISGDLSPDIDWVRLFINFLENNNYSFDAFCILRPTSPFRLTKTIKDAWECFLSDPTADSLRAVRLCREHPGKMWVLRNNRMLPLLPFTINNTPWQSNQYAALPQIYVQDASLEIAWTRTVKNKDSISGDNVIPYISKGYEGYDINYEIDFKIAEYYMENGLVTTHKINKKPYYNVK